jgi:hypothetical protein
LESHSNDNLGLVLQLVNGSVPLEGNVSVATKASERNQACYIHESELEGRQEQKGPSVHRRPIRDREKLDAIREVIDFDRHPFYWTSFSV